MSTHNGIRQQLSGGGDGAIKVYDLKTTTLRARVFVTGSQVPAGLGAISELPASAESWYLADGGAAALSGGDGDPLRFVVKYVGAYTTDGVLDPKLAELFSGRPVAGRLSTVATPLWSTTAAGTVLTGWVGQDSDAAATPVVLAGTADGTTLSALVWGIGAPSPAPLFATLTTHGTSAPFAWGSITTGSSWSAARTTAGPTPP